MIGWVLATAAGQCGASWDPIASSGAYSAVSGVLASAVLIVVGVTISREATTGDRDHVVDAIGLAGLVVLLYSAFEYSVISGESICERAVTANLRAGSLLAVGAVAVIAGVVLLSDGSPTRSTRATAARRNRRLVLGVVGAVAALRLGSGASNALDTLGFGSVTLRIFPLAVAIAATGAGSRSARTTADNDALVTKIYVSLAVILSGCIVSAAVEELVDPTAWYGRWRIAFYLTSCTISIVSLWLIGLMLREVNRASHRSGAAPARGTT